MQTMTRHPSFSLKIRFWPLPLTTVSLRRLSLQPSSSVLETIVLNYVAKVFRQLQRKHSSVWLHCITIMMFLPFAKVKLDFFSYPMFHRLSISLTVCITSVHAIRTSRRPKTAVSLVSQSPLCLFSLALSASAVVPTSLSIKVTLFCVDFCGSCPTPLLASIQLTPSLNQVSQHVPQAAHMFHI